MRHTLARVARATAVLIVPVLMCAPLACAAQDAADGIEPFYRDTAADLVGTPGTLIRQRIVAGAPKGSTAHLLLYRSRDPDNRPIAVSALAIVPDTPAPAGGRPVVAWAHPTSGVVPPCAPSLARVKFKEIQGLQRFLDRGYAVVATDYPGLGTRGPHPYLIGVSEGRSVLDSVRALRALDGARASARFVLWGHSQGGHAALFAASLASAYAPELRLQGVAVAAPATALDTLLRDDADSTGGRNITAMTLWSWQRVYGLPLDHVVRPQALPAMNRLADECIESALDIAERMVSGHPLKTAFLSVPDITRVSPWSTLLRQNIPGPLPPRIPVFIAQGLRDGLVKPDVTRAYATQLCRNGSRVRWWPVAGDGHGPIARDSAAVVAQWAAQRFDGAPVPDDCANLAGQR